MGLLQLVTVDLEAKFAAENTHMKQWEVQSWVLVISCSGYTPFVLENEQNIIAVLSFNCDIALLV